MAWHSESSVAIIVRFLALLVCVCELAHADNLSDTQRSLHATAVLRIDDRELLAKGLVRVGVFLEAHDGWSIPSRSQTEIAPDVGASFESSPTILLEPLSDAHSIRPTPSEISGWRRVLISQQANVKGRKGKGKVHLVATATWKVCQQECLNEQVTLTTEIPLERTATTAEEAALFDSAWTSPMENSLAKSTPTQSKSLTLPISDDPRLVLSILAGAFTGGLFLALLPWVLPILLLHLAYNGGCRNVHARRLLCLSCAFGILTSFSILAALVFYARRAGTIIRWEDQLNSSLFLASMIALMFFGVLHLFGVISLKQGATTATSDLEEPFVAFLIGVLATMLAIPSASPIMDPSLALAFTVSPLHAAAIFEALGIGMALPHLYVGLASPQARLFPAPGPWLKELRQFLAFPLLLAIVWLIWHLGRREGMDVVGAVLVGLVFFGLAGWIFGRWHTPDASRNRKRCATALALGCTVAGCTIAFPQAAGYSFLRAAQRLQFNVVSPEISALGISSRNGLKLRNSSPAQPTATERRESIERPSLQADKILYRSALLENQERELRMELRKG